MAGKGSRKVRTGCVTCKTRRVKCDEAKPSCNRCTAFGLKCDGYRPAGSSSELRHYRPYRVFLGASNPGEGRALQYFCQEAAPYMAGTIDVQFWPKLVMQFTSFDSAVRHAVIAISCLAEWLQHRAGEDEQIRPQDEAFALQHYNAAIRELRNMALLHHQPAALLLMKHTITNYAWTREHLLPLFRRVSVVGFVYGDNPTAFPDLQGLKHPTPTSFTTMDDARVMLDDVLIRTLRLVRNGDAYRRQPEKHTPVPPVLLAQQACLGGVQNSTKILSFILSCRYESCRIWLNTAFGDDDYDYAKHQEAYETMFAQIGIGSGQAQNLFAGDVYFTVVVGYFPSISLVMTKCHHLESRLKSLGLMPLPGLESSSISLKSGGGPRD
ncbi:hypothetical protein LY78DRAFT_716079 [Colletotrichum sublineola]|nr:hypothetical protein LY78DRAFT_716079 [Colletotrichum sublineola]